MKDAADNKTIDAFARQPMSPAERKRAQRERNKANGNKTRMDCYISAEHKQMLDKIRGKVTIETILEKLIEEEYEELEKCGKLYHETYLEQIIRKKKERLGDEQNYSSLKA